MDPERDENKEDQGNADRHHEALPSNGKDSIRDSSLPRHSTPANAPLQLDDLALVTAGGTIMPGHPSELSDPLPSLDLLRRMRSMYGVIEHLEHLSSHLTEPALTQRLMEAFEWRRYIGWGTLTLMETGTVAAGDLTRLYLSGLEQLVEARVRCKSKPLGSGIASSCVTYLDATIGAVTETLKALTNFGYIACPDPAEVVQSELIAIARRRPELGDSVKQLLSVEGQKACDAAFRTTWAAWFKVQATYPDFEKETDLILKKLGAATLPENPDHEIEGALANLLDGIEWHSGFEALSETARSGNPMVLRYFSMLEDEGDLEECLSSLLAVGSEGFFSVKIVLSQFDLARVISALRDKADFPIVSDALCSGVSEFIKAPRSFTWDISSATSRSAISRRRVGSLLGQLT